MKIHIHNDLGYSRTKKGDELNIKIEGLKRFLKEHSSLAEKELKQLELWEHYLIYSILFNQNEKALTELKKITKNINII